MHTDKAHRLRVVTCKRDREAIGHKLGYGLRHEASPQEIAGWMEGSIALALDKARHDLYAASERAVIDAVGPGA